MAQTKTVHVAIQGGMRQDLSEHNAPPGTVVDALNVRFSAVGEVESRPGTNAISLASDADVPFSDVLASTSNGLLERVPGGFLIGAQGYGFRYDYGKARLHISGSYGNAEPLGVFDCIAREEATAATGFPWPLSQAAVNGYVVTVHSCGNGQASIGPGDGRIIVHVWTEDGTLVTSATYLAASAAWVVRDGSSSTDIILVIQNATTGVSARVITTSATGATIGALTSVATLQASTSYWAPCYWPGQGWAIVYQSGATTATIAKFTGVTAGTTQTYTIVDGSPLTAYADATHLYTGHVNGNDALARAYTTGLVLASGGNVTVYTVANVGPPMFGPSLTASAANWLVSASPSAAIEETSLTAFGEVTAAGVASSALYVAYQCTALSAPFGYGYFWARAGGYDNQNANGPVRAVMVDIMAARSAAVTSPSVLPYWTGVVALVGALVLEVGATQVAWYKQHLSAPAELSDGSLVMGVPRLVRSESGFGFALSEWLRFSLGGRRQCVSYAGTAIAAGHPVLVTATVGTRNEDPVLGGTLGSQAAGIDVGFPMPPAMNVTLSNGSGSLTSSALYQWRIVIERIDGHGVRFRSAPSSVSRRTLGASDNTADITGRMNMNWLRANGSSIMLDHSSRFVMHVYRTEANGSTFYRATPPVGVPVSSAAGVFTYTDTIADSLLRRREILYTDGGVLNNDCPPSCRFVAATEDRIWLGGLWETEQVQSSKILVPGEPPQFSDSPAFRVALPEPCTGLAVQDGVVVAFAKSSIYAIQGTGPNDQGQGAWDSPRCITRSTGCISHHSILVTSIGVFFQSGQGIELLPRGLGEPVFVGMPVQDLMYSILTGGVMSVASAAVVTTFRGRTARFVVSDGTTSFLLVYDLDTQAWSRDVYTALVPQAIVDTDEGAVVALNALSSNYGVLQEDLGEDRDSVGNNPAEIASYLEWAELRPFGVAGQGRFHSAVALFDNKGTPSSGYRSGSATIKLSVDRHSEDGKVFNMSTALTSTDYQRVVPAYDNGTAGKLTLTATVGGWRFVGWTVEVDDHGGARRMGETEQG